MAKESRPIRTSSSNVEAITSNEIKTNSRKAGASSETDEHSGAWIRADGAVCFGNECATLKPDEHGKLKLTVKPDRCGAATGAMLIDYLVNTAGKGVVIEIPSSIEPEEKQS
jgi:hypothetical protein